MKKRTKKLMAMVAAVGMMASLFAGCGSADVKETADASTESGG